MGRRYGSKAAYQEARTKMARTEEEWERQRAAERAKETRPTIWVAFTAASLMSGKGHKDATALADAALAAFDHRFIRPIPRDGED